MKTTKKITGLFLVLCMLISIAAVGIVPSSADYVTYAQDTIQGSNILHCFDWSYNNIKAKLPEIAAAGYTAVQTSPVQRPKDYNSSWTDGVNQWWKLYQPLGLSIASSGQSWLGSSSELTALCTEADKYNIKVVVDIVANHLANNGTDGGTYSYINSNVESGLKHSEYYHTNNTRTNDDSRYNITQYHLGMPDLNTGNSTVQTKALNLLKACIDCGVDGFRFDAAKHIETPNDDSSFASQFWPTVINGAKSYAETQGVEEPFFYGEILGSAGPNFGISNYTTYMAVTDNQTGDRALDKAYWQAADELADGTYMKGASADKSVLWVESHDTYMGNSGSAYFSNTQSATSESLNMAWAIVGARADSTGLFFARPNSTMGAASSDTNWKSTAVTEINKFKNHFDGTNEHLSSSGNVAYIERGTKGVVISKLDGTTGSVSLTAHQMANGTYTDQITGNAFTVSDGTISGTVGSTGIAVVYNAEDDALSYISEPTLYLKPNSNWTQASARFAMYVYNSATGATDWVSMTAVSGSNGCYSAAVPSGNWTNVIFCRMNPSTSTNSFDDGVLWNKTKDLFPDTNTNCYTIASGAWTEGDGTWSRYSSSSPTTAPTSAPATAAPTTAPSNTYTIYAINNANWSKVAVHYWGDGETDWPGANMTSISGTKVYSFNIPKNVSGIVFTNGASSSTKQTGNITSGITDGAIWTIGSASSNNYPCSAAPDYYLVGTMNSWTNNNNYKFSITASDSGKLEYKLSGVQLAAGAEFKVHSSSDSWYPSGSNHTVSAAGVYDIYFRPNGDGDSTWLSDSSDSSKRYVKLVDVTPVTVTWQIDANHVLATDSISKGTAPSYTGETPTQESSVSTDYTFTGWKRANDDTLYTDTFPELTADTTFTAQFSESVRNYTVTWKNYDGTVLETDEDAAYGSIPSYDGATPTRPNDGATTYVFAGWSPQITSDTRVTGDITYTARFGTNTQTYTIRWFDGDNNLLRTETCIQGVTPQYTGAMPTKTATDQYTYTFNNTWDPPLVAADRDTDYYAQFDSTVNKYTIRFLNDDGTVLQSSQVEYGTVPTYTGETPTKASTLTNSFVFNSWDTTPVAVTGAADYTATYTPTAVGTKSISVIDFVEWDDVYVYYWNTESDNSWPGVRMTPDADGLVWTASIPESATGMIFSNGAPSNTKQTVDIKTGITDGARWAIPDEKDETETSKYVVHTAPAYYLAGSITEWSATGASEFVPVKNDDKTEEYFIGSKALNSGDGIKAFDGTKWYPDGMENEYTINADGTYNISFRPQGDGDSDWHENVLKVESAVTYTVTWVDDNNQTLETDTVQPDATPSYDGTEPAKEATDQYTYTFTGWKKDGDDTLYTDNFPAVTGDVTYKAQFSRTVREYTITWVDGNGVELKTEEVAYGQTPAYTGATPTKTATGQYTYTFNNAWSPAVTSVRGDKTYYAQFTADVPYLDANGDQQTAQNAVVLSSGSTELAAGWYAVTEDTTISDRITVYGNIHLILCDNALLTASEGIQVNGSGTSLTIYAQSTGEDKGALLIEEIPTGTAGIGAIDGSFTINGGAITIDSWGSGIDAGAGDITINGGDFIINSNSESVLDDAINARTVTINDGDITVNSTHYGISAMGGSVTINGGDINLPETNDGISTGTLTIDGASVTANSTYYTFFCINDITIRNSNVTAKSNSYPISFKGDLTISDSEIDLSTYTKPRCNYGILGMETTSDVTIERSIVSITSCSRGISTDGNITINGGNVSVLGNNYGIYSGSGNISLSWTSSTDSIHTNKYTAAGTVTLQKPFSNGTTVLPAGTVSDLSTINGKTLTPFEPKFTTHSISLDGAIGVNFYAYIGSLAPLGYTVTFTYGGKTTEPIALDLSMYDSTQGAYKVPFYVNSPDMTQDITARLYQTGLSDPLDESTFCVADYGTKLFHLDQTTLTEGDYYLTGDIDGVAYWGTNVQPRWHFTENPNAQGEYMLEHVQLHEGDEFKVIAYHANGEHNWYPAEQNYTVSAEEEGTCTVYFKPDGSGDPDYWHCGTIYVQKETDDLSPLYDLVRSTLNMGAKSQTYFNKHTDNLANGAQYLDYVPNYAEVTDQMLAARIDTEATDFQSAAVTSQLSDCGLSYYGASAVLDSCTALRLYFRIDDADKFNAVKDDVTFGGVDAAPVVATSNGKYIYFEYTNVEAAHLNNSYTLTLGGHDYTYSVMEYLRLARDYAESTEDENLMELVTALYWYNVYADAYFGEV